MSAALAELHRLGRIGDTLRFHSYPRSVLLGRHQHFDREVHADRRLRTKLEFARRITGGGAIYMCPGILAWDIVTDRASIAGGLAAASECICTGVASGLKQLCLPAQYRPPNDVEIRGRKVCGSSGSFDGSTLICQGTVLIDFDMAEMSEALVSSEDESGRVNLHMRVASLAKFLSSVPGRDEIKSALVAGFSRVFGRPLTADMLGEEETKLADRMLAEEIGTDEFVFGDRLPPVEVNQAGVIDKKAPAL
jgi:lipoate-protein ligase A